LTSKAFDKSRYASSLGCVVLVLHFEMVAGAFPISAASHLVVRFFCKYNF
jgi:hypothetical protein